MPTVGNRIYQLFPGLALAPLVPAAAAIGYAEKTARNLLCEGKFPVKTVLVGRKRFVVVDDLARHYAELVGEWGEGGNTPTPPTTAPTPTAEPKPRRPGRGRPRKAEARAEGGAA